MPSNKQKRKLSVWLPYLISALVVILVISILLAALGRMNFFLAFLLFSVLYIVLFFCAALIRNIIKQSKKTETDNKEEKTSQDDAEKSSENEGFSFTYPVSSSPSSSSSYSSSSSSSSCVSSESHERTEDGNTEEKSVAASDNRYIRRETGSDISRNPFESDKGGNDREYTGDPERRPDVEDYLVPANIFGSGRKEKTHDTTSENETEVENGEKYEGPEEGSEPLIYPDLDSGVYTEDINRSEENAVTTDIPEGERNLSGRERIEKVMGLKEGPGSNFETIRPVSEIESERTDLSGNIESKLRNKPVKRHIRSSEFAKNDTKDAKDTKNISGTEERKRESERQKENDGRTRLFDGTDSSAGKEENAPQKTRQTEDTYVSPFTPVKKTETYSSGLFSEDRNEEHGKDKVSANKEKLNKLYGDQKKDRSLFDGEKRSFRDHQKDKEQSRNASGNESSDDPGKDRRNTGFFGMLRKEDKKEKDNKYDEQGSASDIKNDREDDRNISLFSSREENASEVKRESRQPDASGVFARDFVKKEDQADSTRKEAAKNEQKDKIAAPVQERTVRRPKYVIPSVDILRDHAGSSGRNREKEEQSIKDNEEKLLSVLHSFGINATIINSRRGPSVTRYELQPEPGVKVSRILSLSDDIALSLASAGIRFEAPIPGKSAIGIEVPNKDTDIVYFKDVVKSEEYKASPSKVTVGLGKDISGNIIVGDISKYPHLLIAGSTGSGKSVCINTIIASILFKSSPEDVRFIMIDPKVVELGIYNGIPHLLIPVVTNPKKAAGALSWAVNEVENRYAMFAQARVRDIKSYNLANPKNKIPQIIIIIDELADLMMTSAKEVEDSIIRLAQKARAAGVYLVIATQRPSVDVITGLIKANIPSRIAFAVSSYVDSRTIIDTAGAEKLLGRGDMLYHPLGMIKPKRVQGAFISEDEVETLVNNIKSESGEAQYDENVISKLEAASQEKTKDRSEGEDDEKQDTELIMKAGDIGVEYGQMSTSFLQRKLKLGFGRAARIIDVLEEKGVVGPQEGSKPRNILITKDEWEKIKETL